MKHSCYSRFKQNQYLGNSLQFLSSQRKSELCASQQHGVAANVMVCVTQHIANIWARSLVNFISSPTPEIVQTFSAQSSDIESVNGAPKPSPLQSFINTHYIQMTVSVLWIDLILNNYFAFPGFLCTESLGSVTLTTFFFKLANYFILCLTSFYHLATDSQHGWLIG